MTLACIAAALPTPSTAQPLPRTLPGAIEPGRDRPIPIPPPEGSFDFSIESPRRSPVPRAVDELRFELKDIQIVGATKFPPESLRPLYEPLIGKEVGLSDILDVADAIEAKYREAGYIITRAYVPPQRVGNGVFTINVVEGYVSDLAIEGGDPDVRALIDAYLKPVVGARPLDSDTMERALLLANGLPGIQASGLLRPSADKPGASDLVTTVTQTPYTGGISIDNRGSKLTDRWTVSADAEANSLIDAGDQLSALILMSPHDPSERIEGTARYQHPIGTDGLAASFSATVTRGAPVGVVKQFNVTTSSYAAGPRLSYPIFLLRAQSLFVEGGFTYQDAKLEAAGQPVSHDKWRVFDAAAIYTQNGFLNGNSAVTLDVAQGVQFLGATPDGSMHLSRADSDTNFTKVTALLRRVQAIYGPVSFAVIAQGQYAFQSLVVGEQIAFGSTPIGRGYDPSALTGDLGLGGAMELRYDTSFEQYGIQTLEPYVFYDTAKIWNRNGPDNPGSGSGFALASAGLGIRVTLPWNISGGVELARTIKSVPGSDNGHTTKKVLVNAAVRF